MLYKEIPRKVLKKQRPKLKGITHVPVAQESVLGGGNGKGKGWEVGVSLAYALRFPYCWSGEREGKSG